VTQLLERDFAEASKLPASEQDAVASFMLAELESERRWTKSFAASQDKLAKMAGEAMRVFKLGMTKPLDLNHDFPND